MNENTIEKGKKKISGYAAAAAVFGVLFTALMFQTIFKFKPFGVNVPITTAVLYAVLFVAYKGRADFKRGANWVLLPIIALFAFSFMIYNNGLILFLNMVMLIGLTGMQICLMTGKEFPRIFGSGFVKSVGMQVFVRPFAKMGALFKSIFSGGNAKSKRVAGGILIGIAVCIPVAVILLLLLTSADMIFNKMVTDLISWETVWNAVLSVFMFSAVFALTGSALICGAAEGWSPAEPAEKKRARFNIPAVFIVTSVLTLILLIFGAVQVLYLARIKFMPYGFSYSDYARQGFFQLCGAAALVFAVLAIAMSFTVHAEKGTRTGLNIVFTVLAASTLMLLVSAFWRMALYEQEYLYTRLRLYTQAFMILLAVITLFVIVKIWKRDVRLFKPVFYSVVIGMLALTYFNADGFIASQAVKHYESTGEEPDYAYLLSLSKDALPHYAGYLTEDMFDTEYEDMPDINAYFAGKGEPVYADFTESQIKEYDEYVIEFEERACNAYNMKYDLIRLAANADYDDIRSFNIIRARAAETLKLPALQKVLAEE